MADTKTVTCSFTLDRETYDAYKNIVTKNHELRLPIPKMGSVP